MTFHAPHSLGLWLLLAACSLGDERSGVACPVRHKGLHSECTVMNLQAIITWKNLFMNPTFLVPIACQFDTGCQGAAMFLFCWIL